MSWGYVVDMTSMVSRVAAKVGFDSGKHLRLQSKAILDSVKGRADKVYIEFGGKLLDDKHAARVLPGYKEDFKMRLLSKLVGRGADVVLVVSAKDIIRGRIRGDHKITYDKEVLRMLDAAARYGVVIQDVVISMVPKEPDATISSFQDVLHNYNVKTYLLPENEDIKNGLKPFSFDDAPFVPFKSPVVCVVSPGGGSGKFGFCLSQLWKEMQARVSVDYRIIDTFPLLKKEATHPVNLAFAAASADFYEFFSRKNKSLLEFKKGNKEHAALLHIAQQFPHGEELKKTLESQEITDFVSDCITDEELVQKEAAAEVARRVIRYTYEVQRGEEKPEVLDRTKKVLSVLCATNS